jgi:hypothetical protein
MAAYETGFLLYIIFSSVNGSSLIEGSAAIEMQDTFIWGFLSARRRVGVGA